MSVHKFLEDLQENQLPKYKIIDTLFGAAQFAMKAE